MAFLVCGLPPGDPNRSLQGLRVLLTCQEKAQAAIGSMCTSNGMHGMLSRIGGQMQSFRDKELASVLTTANRHTAFLDTIAVANHTRTSSFDPLRLTREKLTVYLILPPEFLKSQSALLRLWVGSLLKACTKGGLQEKRLTRFVLDEAAALGKMDILDEALQMYRGYGVRLHFIYQNIGQLKTCYPTDEGQGLLGATAQVYFGVNDMETATYVSSRLGKSTITLASGGTGVNAGYSQTQSASGGPSSTVNYGTSGNSNWNLSGRELLTPDEVMGMQGVAITFAPGVPPIATSLVPYFHKEFQGTSGSFSRALGALWTGFGFLLCAALLAAGVSTGLYAAGKLPTGELPTVVPIEKSAPLPPDIF